MHPFLGMYEGWGDIAFLLTTDTGDAGTSPHVARRFFQWYSMINIAIYIINNELRYHWSINYITKIASVMMWELTLDEWEKTVLLNSWLDASFLEMYDGRGDIAFLLTTDTGDAGTSPNVARKNFQWYSMTNIAIYIINPCKRRWSVFRQTQLNDWFIG